MYNFMNESNFGTMEQDNPYAEIKRNLKAFLKRVEGDEAVNTVALYCEMLRKNMEKYSPQSEEEILHPIFVRCCNELDLYERYLNKMMTCSLAEREEFIELHKEDIAYADRRINGGHRSRD